MKGQAGMGPRKATAGTGLCADGGHAATIAPGGKTVPRAAGAPAGRAAPKGNGDIPAWPLDGTAGDGTGRSESAVRPATGRAGAGRHGSEDIEI